MKLLIQKNDGTVEPIEFTFTLDMESEEDEGETVTDDIELAIDYLSNDEIGLQVVSDIKAYLYQEHNKKK